MSDVVWQALIAGVVTLTLAWMQLRTQALARSNAVKVEEVKTTLETVAVKAAVKAEEVKVALETAAVKVEEVKAVLADTEHVTDLRFDKLAKVAKATHTLVNNAMATQLRLNMVVTKQLADETGKPAHLEQARQAELLYQEHMRKQDVVDADSKPVG